MSASPSPVAAAPPEATHTEKETATSRASEKNTGTDKETVSKASEKASGTERESARPTKPNKVYTDQCGFEDDEDDYEPWEGPQRIRQTQATPAQQAKCRSLLSLVFSKSSVGGKRVMFDPNDVMDVIEWAIKYFESEPVLIEDVPFGITIVGDLHGQLYDLARICSVHAKHGKPGYECAKYLFLGDYVDRGWQSLEVVVALFSLKILYPDNFFILRGNHEFSDMNMRDGFCEEIHERFEERTATAIFWSVNEAFCYLSMAAIVGDIYFCSHGGISPRGFTRAQMRGIAKPIAEAGADSLVHDLCWSDPAVGLKGTTFNQDRGVSIHFGLDALVHALHSVGCVALFRGHNVMEDGYDIQWNMCITIFSASGVGGGVNKAACGDIDDEGKLIVRMFPVDQQRVAVDRLWFGPEEEKTVDVGCVKTGIAIIEE